MDCSNLIEKINIKQLNISFFDKPVSNKISCEEFITGTNKTKKAQSKIINTNDNIDTNNNKDEFESFKTDIYNNLSHYQLLYLHYQNKLVRTHQSIPIIIII